MHVHQKLTIDQSLFSLFFQRYLKGSLVDNLEGSLIIYCLNFKVVLERVTELDTAYY